MALQTNGTDRIDNTGQLVNISSSDATTQSTINTAIKNQNNVLVIYNSAGTALKTLYCAKT